VNRNLNWTKAPILMILGFALLAAGCSTDHGTSPALSRVNGPEAGNAGPSSQDQGSLARARSTGSLPQGLQAGGSVALSTSADVDGAVGGTLSVGRITLTFAPGAFSGTKTITIYDTSNGGVSCQLYPEGLQFSQPVTLQMQLVGTSLDDSTATVDWFNPNAGSWVGIGGNYQSPDHSVVANLQHFSTYRGSRAGW